MKEKEKFTGFQEHDYKPIIREKSLALLIDLLKKHKPKQILEVGAFIGYSAAVMLETCPNAYVVTVEKDEENAKFAIQNLNELGFVDRFEVANQDAYDFLIENKKKFDFIFLDGPKGQYIKYLPYLKECLNKGGVLVADDIMFYGLVSFDGKIDHKHRSLVNNLRKFLDALKADKDFSTEIHDFEDGMSVSIKLK